MKCKSETLVHGSLAACAAAALLAVAPALGQTQTQYTPPAHTYQNNTGQNNAGAMQTNPTGTQGAATESLSNVQNAKTTLASAQVKDSSGQQVGQVRNVHTGSTGTPTKIDITLTPSNGGRAKTVSVRASELKYDQNSNTLITNLSASALQSMPTASSSSM
ncbi:MAG TPA: hypothetical protein VGL35_09665 [Rhizomicrobium sp.]|jgi:hypothetical protein